MKIRRGLEAQKHMTSLMGCEPKKRVHGAGDLQDGEVTIDDWGGSSDFSGNRGDQQRGMRSGTGIR